MTSAPASRIPRPRYGRLWFGFLGAGVAWGIHEIVAYAVVAHSCYPMITPYSNPQDPATRAIALGVLVVLLVVALLSLLVAWRQWNYWQPEHAAVDWREDLMESTEARAYRYLSFTGILFGVLFSALIAYSIIAALVLQTCSY